MITRLVTLCTAILFSQSLFSQAGTPDNSFGNNGVTAVPLKLFSGENYVRADRIVQQKDGKFLVAATSYGFDFYHAYIYRFRKDGTIDSTFGTNGRIFMASGTNNYIYFYGLTLDKQERILFVADGDNSNATFQLVRLKKDGQYDSTFSDDGIVQVQLPGENALFGIYAALAVQQDGKILIGAHGLRERPVTAVICYNENGTLNIGFNSGGYHIFNPKKTLRTAGGYYDHYAPFGLQPDGKIIFSNLFKPTLYRLNANGTRDFSFGDNGLVTGAKTNKYGSTWGELLYDIRILPDGSFATCGASVFYDNEGGGISVDGIHKFTKSGLPDSLFSSNGKVVVHNDLIFQNNTSVGNLTIQPDKKFLFSDIPIDGMEYSAIARYKKTGVIDSSFADNGRIKFTKYGSFVIEQILLQPDDRIIAIGNNSYYQASIDTGYFYIFRYNSDVAVNPIAVEASHRITEKEKTSISIAPNPAGSILIISGLSSKTQLSIVNVGGKTVARAVASSDTYNWDIQSLSSGNYFLIVTQNNKMVASMQFIKQ